LAIDVTLESSSTDNVHWKLSEATSVDYSTIEIITTSTPLNWIISHMSSEIKKLIVMGLTKGVDTEINALNAMVAQEKPYSFDVTVMNLTTPLNLTMSMAPSIIKDSHLIKLNFDGLFDAPESINQMNYELENHAEFPALTKSHREQFWIH
jgi:ribonucleotide monophosphatase NagD (HAD superfamily)